MGILEARDIAFGYGRTNVWEHVSLALEPGEMVLLVGGKSDVAALQFHALVYNERNL